MVRLEVIPKFGFYSYNKFQFLMVRLEVRLLRRQTRALSTFQFLMVRLEGRRARRTYHISRGFQFLMVRLEGVQVAVCRIVLSVSIPYGSIRRRSASAKASR